MKSPEERILIRIIYMACDVFCIVSAIYVVLLIKHDLMHFNASFEGFFSVDNAFRTFFLWWIPIILFFNQTHGLYQTNREQFETLEIWKVVKSVFVSMLVIIVLAFLLKIQGFPRSVMMLTPVVIAFFFSLWRFFKKMLVNYLVINGYNNFNAIIIGAGKVGTVLAEEIERRPEMGIKVIGFLDDYKQGVCGKWPILGTIEHFTELAKKHFINKVFITIYHNSDVFVRVLEKSRSMDMSVRVVPQGYEWMNNDLVQYNVGIVPVLAYFDGKINHRHRTKRVFDVVVASILLIFLIPIFIIIALLILWDSPGPVFYKSKRYGKGGRMFYMFKFRSMVVNADDLLKDLRHKNEVDGPIFKIRKDPRVTPLGAWLRKYSLDELPQVLNVIIGDMSLVGPRPLPIEQVEKEDFRQLRRLDIRPGITGLWQIKGRSDVTFDKLLRWDIWYINNWSFGLDVYILLQTIPAVLKGKGAY